MDNPGDGGTEAKILAAAIEVFTRDGFDGARMQTIAETAGINKALLHYYFRSKQNLFERVLQEKFVTFLPKIQATFARDISTYEKMEYFVDAYIEMLLANPGLPLFVLFSVHRHPEFVLSLPKAPLQPILEELSLAVKEGRMREVDPQHFFTSILSMCIFPFASRKMSCHMMGKTDEEYMQFLRGRKEQIMIIIKAVMQP